MRRAQKNGRVQIDVYYPTTLTNLDSSSRTSVVPYTPPPSTAAPGLGGIIGPDPADFVVDEIPAYAFDGEGEHWLVHVKKVGVTTPDAVRAVARAAGVRDRDVGVAGMKDKHAITSQWFSLSTVGSTPPTAWALPDNITLLSFTKHRNKLRTGHLRGNRFSIRLRSVAITDEAALEARVEAIREAGVPNYYGAQRYGHGLQNLDKALQWLLRQNNGQSRRGSRFDAKWMPSVIQSEVFNRYVALRMKHGLDRLLVGEVVRLSGSSRHFEVTEPDVELERLLSRDIVLSGPIIGPKMKAATGDAWELEQAAVHELGLDEAALSALAKVAPGARRDVVVWPEDLKARLLDEQTVELSFSLPAGSYATQVVRELTHCPFGQERARSTSAQAPARDEGPVL